MNKKGFTVVEVVIAFSILAVILVSLFTYTVIYRDKVSTEEIRTQLIDFKNTITKTIYDDIVMDNYFKIESCGTNCVNFVDYSNNNHPLQIVTISENTQNRKKGLYLNYDGTYYMLPDSDLNKDTENMCAFETISLQNYQNKIFHLRIPFIHYILNEKFEIMITLN